MISDQTSRTNDSTEISRLSTRERTTSLPALQEVTATRPPQSSVMEDGSCYGRKAGII